MPTFSNIRRYGTAFLLVLLLATRLGAVLPVVAGPEASDFYDGFSHAHQIVLSSKPVKGLAVIEPRVWQVPPLVRRASLDEKQKVSKGAASPEGTSRILLWSSHEISVRVASAAARYDVLHVYRL